MAINLPDWNDLSNDERTKLVRIVEWFNWPPRNDGQFALEFYNELAKLMRDHEARLPMTS